MAGPLDAVRAAVQGIPKDSRATMQLDDPAIAAIEIDPTMRVKHGAGSNVFRYNTNPGDQRRVAMEFMRRNNLPMTQQNLANVIAHLSGVDMSTQEQTERASARSPENNGGGGSNAAPAVQSPQSDITTAPAVEPSAPTVENVSTQGDPASDPIDNPLQAAVDAAPAGGPVMPPEEPAAPVVEGGTQVEVQQPPLPLSQQADIWDNIAVDLAGITDEQGIPVNNDGRARVHPQGRPPDLAGRQASSREQEDYYNAQQQRDARQDDANADIITAQGAADDARRQHDVQQQQTRSMEDANELAIYEGREPPFPQVIPTVPEAPTDPATQDLPADDGLTTGDAGIMGATAAGLAALVYGGAKVARGVQGRPIKGSQELSLPGAKDAQQFKTNRDTTTPEPEAPAPKPAPDPAASPITAVMPDQVSDFTRLSSQNVQARLKEGGRPAALEGHPGVMIYDANDGGYILRSAVSGEGVYLPPEVYNRALNDREGVRRVFDIAAESLR